MQSVSAMRYPDVKQRPAVGRCCHDENDGDTGRRRRGLSKDSPSAPGHPVQTGAERCPAARHDPGITHAGIDGVSGFPRWSPTRLRSRFAKARPARRSIRRGAFRIGPLSCRDPVSPLLARTGLVRRQARPLGTIARPTDEAQQEPGPGCRRDRPDCCPSTVSLRHRPIQPGKDCRRRHVPLRNSPDKFHLCVTQAHIEATRGSTVTSTSTLRGGPGCDPKA